MKLEVIGAVVFSVEEKVFGVVFLILVQNRTVLTVSREPKLPIYKFVIN